MPWEYETTLKWVSDLGSPLQPKTCLFKGAAVPISDDHIRRAEAKLGNGASEVVFNARFFEPTCGERRFELGRIAGAF
jgi:hypothetical protein